MPKPTDEKLYESIKRDLFKKYVKPSAYRSGLLVQKYKEEYVKKHKNHNYYNGSKTNSNLKRWFDEIWINQKGKIGYQNKSDVYRPTVRINSKTPTTFNELNKVQIKKAMMEKLKTGRVKKFNV